jgi:hypothetical protein
VLEGVEEIVAEGVCGGGDIGELEEFIQAGAKSSAGGSLRKVQVAQQVAQDIVWGIGRICRERLPYGHASSI